MTLPHQQVSHGTASEMTVSLQVVATAAKREALSRNNSHEDAHAAAASAERQQSDPATPTSDAGPAEDTRLGHLLVVHGDWLTDDEDSAGGGSGKDLVPPLLRDGLTSALEAVTGRCVMVCTGGSALSHAMIRQIVATVGLDAVGPGHLIEMLLKEGAGEWGNVWESALLCKALAKRSAIRYDRVTSVTCAPMAEVTRRVYEHVLSDWRPQTIFGSRTVPASDGLAARSQAIVADDGWFARNAKEFAPHPSMPRTKGTKRPHAEPEEEAQADGRSSPAPHRYLVEQPS